MAFPIPLGGRAYSPCGSLGLAPAAAPEGLGTAPEICGTAAAPPERLSGAPERCGFASERFRSASEELDL